MIGEVADLQMQAGNVKIEIIEEERANIDD
jgi:hypothetical protein